MTDYALGTTIYYHFTTRAFGTGVPTTLGGTPALSVLEENNATPITSGVSVSVDRASVTGLNEATIVASSGNGFESGKEYALYISTGTVGGVSVVGEVVGRFSIEKDSALKPVTAGRKLVVDAAGLGDANVVKLGPSGSGSAQTARDIGANVLLSPGTGTGQLDFTSGVVKSNLVQILATALTETVGGYLTAGFKKLFDVAAPVFTTASVNQTGDSYARIGANGAGLTSVGDTSGTTTLLSRLSSTRAGYLDNLSVGAVALEASVQSVLSKLLKYVQLILRKDAAIATDNATEVTAINANGGSGGGAFANTTDSQEALRDRGDSAWTTATGFSTHSAADVWVVGTRTLTSFGALVADVWAYATRVLTGYGTLTAPLDAAGTRTAVGLGSANLDTQLGAHATALAAVDTNVDDLKSGIILGAAATGTLSTTQATSNLSGYADDQLIGRVIVWLTGNCEGEATDITDYASASGLLTFTALTTAPGNGDTFKIV